MKKQPKYSPEVIERAVRMVSEAASEYESQWAAITSIAARIGCTPETLRRWVRQQESDAGQRPGPTAAEEERIKALEHEVRAAQGKRDPASGECVFRAGGARPPLQAVRAFIDQYRHAYGVEPICRVMQVAPSGYWRYAAQQRNPQLRCTRTQRDDVLSVDIERVWEANLQVYGADKVWR